MSHLTERISLGRQPVLDKNSNIFGFEILVRSESSLASGFGDGTSASANAIMNTLSDFGLKELVGKRHKALFHVNGEILMSDMIELLPHEQVVIELHDSIHIDGAVVNRCKDLKKLGFSLALSDFVYNPSYDSLFESIDIVKINLKEHEPDTLSASIAPLQGLPIKLLAEKVEDVQEFEQAKALGFDMFQGYYFARPSVISGKKIDPSGITVMKLVNQMLRDDDLAAIEQTFRQSPSLSVNLLRLVNSVSLGMREKISSVRHAIVLLGRAQLNRWAQVLLFTHGESLAHENPLLSTAVMRGRFMELLVEKGALGGSKQVADLAFMTGMLSLIDALMLKPMEEVLEQLGLVEVVCNALLRREGDLGQLLSMIEFLERSDFAAIMPLAEHCKTDVQRLIEAEQEATVWTNKLTTAF